MTLSIVCLKVAVSHPFTTYHSESSPLRDQYECSVNVGFSKCG